jgi:hypothetical protein
MNGVQLAVVVRISLSQVSHPFGNYETCFLAVRGVIDFTSNDVTLTIEYFS